MHHPILFLALVSVFPAAQEPGVELLAHDELTVSLHVLADTHEHVELLSIGRSRGNRAIEGVRIGPAVEGKPAILLVANLDGPRVFASGVALHHARKLAEGYATDEAIRSFLDRTNVYVLPRGNPDAAEARFDTPRSERRAGGHGVDNDRDGRFGEDGPADVDGDGAIATIRVEDPEGTWVADPTDPRAMVEADSNKGQRGRWKTYVEGRDADGDEDVAEDPAADTLVNRNFASGWEQHEPYAGLFPTDEPEALALAEFFLAHDDVALVVTYDELDNLVEAPKSVKDDAPSVKRIPPAGVLESDAALLKELGERYREATGSEAKSSEADEGTFQRFCYDHRGLLALNAVLWDMPMSDPPEEEESEEGEEETAKKEEPSDDAKRLAWIDEQGEAESWRFLDWKPFEHPELGPVEIGGFAPYARIEPPESEWDEIADEHLAFLLGLSDALARVELVECTATPLDANVWRVEAAIENNGLLPLQTRSARRTRTVRPALVKLVLPEAGELLAGRARESVSVLDGAGGREEFTWLVTGPESMEIGVTVETTHAGIAQKKAEVVR